MRIADTTLEKSIAPVQPNEAANLQISNSIGRWHSVMERLLINLVGGIPRPIGTSLRQLLYPMMFAHMGRAAHIQASSEFIGAAAIELGDGVRLLRDVRLNAKAAGSYLRIGNEVCFDRGVDVNVAGEDCLIEIGDGSYLGSYVCMAGPGPIRIGKHCLIASQAGLYANNHRSYGLSREGITIEDNCWLGSGVKVLDGVTIGRGSVVGAGAVVTKDIPPYSIAVGVPAVVIKRTTGEGVA